MNFNPLQMMMQMGQKQQQPQIQNPPLDPQRFRQMAPKLTKENQIILKEERSLGSSLFSFPLNNFFFRKISVRNKFTNSNGICAVIIYTHVIPLFYKVFHRGFSVAS